MANKIISFYTKNIDDYRISMKLVTKYENRIYLKEGHHVKNLSGKEKQKATKKKNKYETYEKKIYSFATEMKQQNEKFLRGDYLDRAFGM